MTEQAPSPWYKTSTFWFTLAALIVSSVLFVKLFPSDSKPEKLLMVANMVLVGLGFSGSRKDVNKAWDMPPRVQQEEAKPSERNIPNE
jgi:hypothetical protein